LIRYLTSIVSPISHHLRSAFVTSFSGIFQQNSSPKSVVAVRGIREVYAGAGGVAAVNVVQLRGFAWIVHSHSKNVLVLRGMG
jgi:hypothetical protein